MTKTVVVIGGGPGGYVSAIRAAQLGAQVVLIEKDTLGGTCVNRGCIPAKVLLQSAESFAFTKNAGIFGISADNVTLDFLAVKNRKAAVIQKLVSGLTSLMRKNKIKLIHGTATLIDPRQVAIVESGERISCDNIIIATGSNSTKLRVEGLSGPAILDSDAFLAMEQPSSTALIVGGGVIGVEYAQILCGMGSQVSIIEMMPQILPQEDTEMAALLENVLTQKGIEICTGASITRIRENERRQKVVSFKAKNGEQSRVVDSIVVCVGRQPNIEQLGTQACGIETEQKRIIVNKRMETGVPGIYAIGDVTGGYMLAHVAMQEGRYAAENIFGKHYEMDHRKVPRCIYTSPEMASVGLSEADAAKESRRVAVGRFPLSGNGRALTMDQTTGLIKIIADTRHGEILGVHIIAPHATELIAEAVLAMSLEATIEDLTAATFAHPTLSEAVMEAALVVEGMPIHI